MDVQMSGGRKAVQGGVQVKLPAGVTWDSLAKMSPEEIKEGGVLPEGFQPLPHVKQLTGEHVFPARQIDEIARQDQRNLRRFDVDYDFAMQTLPAVLQHLEMAQGIMSGLTGAPPQGLAASSAAPRAATPAS